MRRRELLRAACLSAVAPFLTTPLCQAAEGEWHERVQPLMGTFVSVAVFGLARERADALITDCFHYIGRVVGAISDWEEESDPSRLRREGRLARNQLSAEFVALAELATSLRHASAGKFNPLCHSLSLLWRDARATQSLPHKNDVRHHLVRSSRSTFQLGSSTVGITGGSGFDFGGIGKGYVADLAAHYLRANGASTARVACSGDIAFVGATEWLVEVEDPREEGSLASFKRFGNFGVATSGDYRSCWSVNGTKYHHLIDPSTGMPACYAQQVTVIHPLSAVADGLSTAAFCMPVAHALRFISSVPGAEGMIVDQSHRLWSTRGVVRV